MAFNFVKPLIDLGMQPLISDSLKKPNIALLYNKQSLYGRPRSVDAAIDAGHSKDQVTWSRVMGYVEQVDLTSKTSLFGLPWAGVLLHGPCQIIQMNMPTPEVLESL